VHAYVRRALGTALVAGGLLAAGAGPAHASDGAVSAVTQDASADLPFGEIAEAVPHDGAELLDDARRPDSLLSRTAVERVPLTDRNVRSTDPGQAATGPADLHGGGIGARAEVPGGTVTARSHGHDSGTSTSAVDRPVTTAMGASPTRTAEGSAEPASSVTAVLDARVLAGAGLLALLGVATGARLRRAPVVVPPRR
jgi:hypothetical protein